MSSQQLPIAVKEETKEEDIDDFLITYLFANPTVDEKPELKQDLDVEIDHNTTVPDQNCVTATDTEEEIDEEEKDKDEDYDERGQCGAEESFAKSKSNSPKAYFIALCACCKQFLNTFQRVLSVR